MNHENENVLSGWPKYRLTSPEGSKMKKLLCYKLINKILLGTLRKRKRAADPYPVNDRFDFSSQIGVSHKKNVPSTSMTRHE